MTYMEMETMHGYISIHSHPLSLTLTDHKILTLVLYTMLNMKLEKLYFKLHF